jgi:predicted  nucleic acid-binding Zn-ribbon protein
MEKTIRCTICGTEFSDDELPEGTCGCPNCGTKSLPCDIKDDVSIKINWHELRILTIWAENWAKYIDKTDQKEEKLLLSIMTITQRLEKQFPDKTPLTLFREIRELRKNYDIETNIDNDKLLGL